MNPGLESGNSPLTINDNLITDCYQPLGMEDGRIEDSQITASSYLGNPGRHHGPKNARLNSVQTATDTGGWVAGVQNTNQWIQVNLRALMRVSGVIIQGRSGFNMRVLEFKVLFKSFGTIWKYVTDANDTDILSPNKIN